MNRKYILPSFFLLLSILSCTSKTVTLETDPSSIPVSASSSDSVSFSASPTSVDNTPSASVTFTPVPTTSATSTNISTPAPTDISAIPTPSPTATAISTVLQSGNIATLAGNGTLGFLGEGTKATAAELNLPYGIVADKDGNIFFADKGNFRIRKIDKDGIITTIAGNGTSGSSGDGGDATAAEISAVQNIALDNLGNLYLADSGNNKIRKISLGGIITTIAGTGVSGSGGDDSSATRAELSSPYGVAVDSSGNVYISDSGNYKIRKISTTGIISTIAGDGTGGFLGDNADATTAKLNFNKGLAIDSTNNIYIADSQNYRIRKIDTNGIITTIAGTGVAGDGDSGIAATLADLSSVSQIAIDDSNNIYVADITNSKIKKIDTNGIITTIAGISTQGFSGENTPATKAALSNPSGIAVDSTGNIYISDTANNRIRKIAK